MKRIIRQQGDGFAVGALHADEAHLGIGGAGRFDEVWVIDAGIGLHLIGGDTERRGQNAAGLHLPASIEDLMRHRSAAVANFCRSEVVQGTPHAIGNAPSDKALINRVRLALAHGLQSPAGVRVRGGHHHVFQRQSGGLVHHLLRLVKDAAPDHTAIRDDEYELRLAIIEREAACVQFIVDVGRFAVLKTAINRAAELGRDVAGGSSGTEFSAERGTGYKQRKKSEFHPAHTRLKQRLNPPERPS